jgi:hypothetical protein
MVAVREYPDQIRRDRIGPDKTGLDKPRPFMVAVTRVSRHDTTRLDSIGHDKARHNTTRQDKTFPMVAVREYPDKTRLDMTRRYRTGRDWTRRDRTRHDLTRRDFHGGGTRVSRPDMTRRDKTRHDLTRQDATRQDNFFKGS